MNLTEKLLAQQFNIDEKVLKLVAEAEEEVRGEFEKLDDIMAYNQYKVLKAFQKNRIREMHFGWKTGYGYDDAGRDALGQTFADVFHTDAALVRTTFVNGTHALATTLLGLLRPGDELIYATGEPYDTLQTVIGLTNYEKGNGSLRDYGITFKQVDLLPDGSIDIEGVKAAITDKTRMITAQRATGYSWRKAISIDEIEKLMKAINEVNPDIIKMVDNSYGEFLDTREPSDVGADMIVGSLIKNPGGGLAPIGGYICGTKECVEQCSYRLSAPGLGQEIGANLGIIQSMYQGFFLAPTVVAAALKGAIFAANIYEKLGFKVVPNGTESRHDIIQAVELGSPERMISFCKGIQAAAPVDSHLSPEPWPMPGYDNDVIMAAGAFIQGSSIELSADGPIRPPYAVYFQGGLTWSHAKLGILMSLQKLYENKLINL